ncbi:amidohydrolase family protein [bacterium]|nr:amidohydrolase family protein [candidate division CSSED10-310 bacterium]
MPRRIMFREALITTSERSFAADIAVEDGVIREIGSGLKGIFDREYHLRYRRVLPGCIDPHVHFALPVGNRMTSDDFVTGSRNALAGGVTTVIDFSTPEKGVPLDQTVRKRIEEANVAECSVFLHATVCGWTPDRESEAERCLELGVRSFKFFTAYEESGRRTPYAEIELAAAWAARLDARIIVHAEDHASLLPSGCFASDSFSYYETSRPVASEVSAITALSAIQQRTGAAMAIVHVSSGSGVDAANGSGLKLETCPHYLTRTRDVYNRPNGYQYAVAPPLRSREEQERLWTAVETGKIDWIGSDHAPFSEEERIAAGDHFLKAPFGLAGVRSLLGTMIAEGVMKNRITWERLVALTSTNAAMFYRMFPRKGAICEGSDADLIVIDEAMNPSILSVRRAGLSVIDNS